MQIQKVININLENLECGWVRREEVEIQGWEDVFVRLGRTAFVPVSRSQGKIGNM